MSSNSSFYVASFGVGAIALAPLFGKWGVFVAFFITPLVLRHTLRLWMLATKKGKE